jgi:hypothetical protein
MRAVEVEARASWIGLLPVAMTMFFVSRVLAPSGPSTATVLRTRDLGHALHDLDAVVLEQATDATGQLPTMPSFQATSLSTSSLKARRPEMPITSALLDLLERLAALISALLGMQPTLRQTPPT